MVNLYTRTRNFKLLSKIRHAFLNFNKTEWYVFLALLAVLFISTVAILARINKHYMVEVPISGGSFSEGIVGAPRFINPILASTDADKDLVSIIYSGLMRKDNQGNIIPDLAESVEISKDGLTYTFTLKDNIFFHDNTKVTVNDVLFTIDSAKDAIVKSPIKSNWDGVTVEKIDEKTIKFSLKRPYSSLLENSTLGILPAHLWKDSPIELNEHNINPVGTGPYEIYDVVKESGGQIESYTLTAFKKFSLGKPYIKEITFKFYQNEDELIEALKNGKVEQISSISPVNALNLKEDGYQIDSAVLPRIFGIFFNQNQNQIFTNKNVVRAIELAIDKENIIKEVLSGYAVAIDDPIPPNMVEYQEIREKNSESYEEKVNKAVTLLEKDGWKRNDEGYFEKTLTEKNKKTVTPLQFSISTSNAPELSLTANLIKNNLEKVGMKVEVKTFDIGNLNQIVIRPRKYDALLFGQIINNEPDLFAFWHSSQRKDPGLNIAMYTNAKVDKILEDAFITIDENTRIKKYAQFEEEIKKDKPAVFLYSPEFIYVTSKKIKNVSIDNIISPHDRFLNSYLWYTKTDGVWKIFAK